MCRGDFLDARGLEEREYTSRNRMVFVHARVAFVCPSERGASSLLTSCSLHFFCAVLGSNFIPPLSLTILSSFWNVVFFLCTIQGYLVYKTVYMWISDDSIFENVSTGDVDTLRSGLTFTGEQLSSIDLLSESLPFTTPDYPSLPISFHRSCNCVCLSAFSPRAQCDRAT